MFKGKYVLVSVNELKWRILDYLKVNYSLVTNNESLDEDTTDESSNMILEIKKSDIICDDIKKFTAQIVGQDKHLIDDLTFDFEYKEKLAFNMTECTYMLKKIFEIDENISFDDVMFTNEDEDIYLFYVDLN